MYPFNIGKTRSVAETFANQMILKGIFRSAKISAALTGMDF